MSLDRYIVVIERNHSDDLNVIEAADKVNWSEHVDSIALRTRLVRQLRRELQEGWEAAAIAGHFRIVDCELGDKS